MFCSAENVSSMRFFGALKFVAVVDNDNDNDNDDVDDDDDDDDVMMMMVVVVAVAVMMQQQVVMVWCCCRFDIDEISPGKCDPLNGDDYDYEILSRAIKA